MIRDDERSGGERRRFWLEEMVNGREVGSFADCRVLMAW